MKFSNDIPVFGDTKWRGECPSESAEQVTFFGKLRRELPELAAVAIHPRNEGKRTHGQTMRHKAEGMTPGASDIIIPGLPAFVCELKRKDHTKSRWQPQQPEYLEQCKKLGAFACVALGHEAAWQALKEWQKSLKPTQ
jgi:hypothetical protein